MPGVKKSLADICADIKDPEIRDVLLQSEPFFSASHYKLINNNHVHYLFLGEGDFLPLRETPLSSSLYNEVKFQLGALKQRVILILWPTMQSRNITWPKISLVKHDALIGDQTKAWKKHFAVTTAEDEALTRSAKTSDLHLQYLCAKDDYTMEHSYRVSMFSGSLGRSIPALASHLDRLVEAAKLHDLGKIGVPESYLYKEGRLSDEEQYCVNRHSTVGLGLVALSMKLDYVSGYIPIVSHHLSPDHIYDIVDNFFSGDDRETFIETALLCTSVLKMSDSLDAMTSKRPYKDRRNIKEVIDTLTKDIDSLPTNNRMALPFPINEKDGYKEIFKEWLASSEKEIEAIVNSHPTPN